MAYRITRISHGCGNDIKNELLIIGYLNWVRAAFSGRTRYWAQCIHCNKAILLPGEYVWSRWLAWGTLLGWLAPILLIVGGLERGYLHIAECGGAWLLIQAFLGFRFPGALLALAFRENVVTAQEAVKHFEESVARIGRAHLVILSLPDAHHVSGERHAVVAGSAGTNAAQRVRKVPPIVATCLRFLGFATPFFALCGLLFTFFAYSTRFERCIPLGPEQRFFDLKRTAEEGDAIYRKAQYLRPSVGSSGDERVMLDEEWLCALYYRDNKSPFIRGKCVVLVKEMHNGKPTWHHASLFTKDLDNRFQPGSRDEVGTIAFYDNKLIVFVDIDSKSIMHVAALFSHDARMEPHEWVRSVSKELREMPKGEGVGECAALNRWKVSRAEHASGRDLIRSRFPKDVSIGAPTFVLP